MLNRLVRSEWLIPTAMEVCGSTFAKGPNILTGNCRDTVFAQDTGSFRDFPRDSLYIFSSYYIPAQSAARGQRNTAARATILCCPRRHFKENKYFNHFPSKAEIERRTNFKDFIGYLFKVAYFTLLAYLAKMC
jgi:hypothetical protein